MDLRWSMGNFTLSKRKDDSIADLPICPGVSSDKVSQTDRSFTSLYTWTRHMKTTPQLAQVPSQPLEVLLDDIVVVPPPLICLTCLFTMGAKMR